MVMSELKSTVNQQSKKNYPAACSLKKIFADTAGTKT
jgi:hypothetical protein